MGFRVRLGAEWCPKGPPLVLHSGRIRATLVTHTPISFDLSGVTRGGRVRDTKIPGMFSKLLRIVFCV